MSIETGFGLLNEILNELFTVTPEEVAAVEPNDCVSSDEALTGVVADHLRKLCALQERYMIEGRKLESGIVPHNCMDADIARLCKIRNLVMLINKMFWMELYAAQPKPMWDDHLGIRNGWVVVRIKGIRLSALERYTSVDGPDFGGEVLH